MTSTASMAIRNRPWMTVVQGLIVRSDKLVLMAHRPPDKKKPLMWEYPGGKVDADETLPQALARELKEELDIDAIIGAKIDRCEFFWKENVEIHLYVVTQWTGEPKALVATELKWIDPEYSIDHMPCLPGVFASYMAVKEFLEAYEPT